MSRIGRQPVKIPPDVSVKLENGKIIVKGKKGELSFAPHPRVEIKINGNEITVSRKSDEKFDKSLHGTTRMIIANMVTGVSSGFEKKLEMQGVGYRVELKGKKLVLALGFSHPIEYELPQEITVAIDPEKKNIFTVSGIDKQLVGEVAAQIRAKRPPEPYKGKGIRYHGEIIIKKAGKTAVASGAPGGTK